MKQTVFKETHEKLGAKMVEFAGYCMPVQYEGVTAEHLHVRSKVGVFDVSHMGEFTVKGPKALDLLQYITSNDVAALYPGKVQYSRTAKAASLTTSWSITSPKTTTCWW